MNSALPNLRAELARMASLRKIAALSIGKEFSEVAPYLLRRTGDVGAAALRAAHGVGKGVWKATGLVTQNPVHRVGLLAAGAATAGAIPEVARAAAQAKGEADKPWQGRKVQL